MINTTPFLKAFWYCPVKTGLLTDGEPGVNNMLQAQVRIKCKPSTPSVTLSYPILPTRILGKISNDLYNTYF